MPASAVHTAFKDHSLPISAEWSVEKGVKVPITSGINKKTTTNVNTDICRIRFNLPENMKPPVLFYYYLENFYQNHRRYVDSFDADQLKGKASTYSELKDSKCTPLKGEGGNVNKPYYPCGLIANSLFNDTFSSPMWLNAPGSDTAKEYKMENNSQIAWDSDKSLYGSTKYKPEDVLPPKNWAERYPNNYTEENPPPDLENWEAFQVWMRTAGLPVFSKLYQRNDHEDMQKGNYEIVIHDRTSLREDV